MAKSSFTVCYVLGRQIHLVLGVTSIVPNLNGFLMFTEDGKNHFIESHELHNESLGGMGIGYRTDYDMVDYDVLHDHRKEVAR